MLIPYYLRTIVPKKITFHRFDKDEQKIFSLSKTYKPGLYFTPHTPFSLVIRQFNLHLLALSTCRRFLHSEYNNLCNRLECPHPCWDKKCRWISRGNMEYNFFVLLIHIVRFHSSSFQLTVS